MSSSTGNNATYFSNYPNAPDGVVRSDAPVKAHPLVLAQGATAAGVALSTKPDVGGSSKNSDGVGTRSDTKR